ncbi:MAG: hypothetical protein R8K50_08730 [Mariprofundus sp.]
MRNNGRTLSREELYDLIWTMPTTKLAKELGISDVGLGKICKRLEVPKPPLGYWRKAEVGARLPKKPPLKKLSPKGQQQTTIYPAPPESRPMKSIRAAEAIPFPDALLDPHRLTKRTMSSFNKAKTDERGVLLSRNKIHLDVRVTQDTLGRACLIMDTLIKTIELRGHKVRTEGERPLKTIVEVDGESIGFSLDEKIQRTDHRPTTEEKRKHKDHYWRIPRYDHLPTGNLSLNILEWSAPRKRWSDGKRQKIEGCLGSFIQGLLETAVKIKADREQRRLDKIRWAEEEKRRQERDRLVRIEKKKAEKLIADVDRCQQAECIRAYIRQMESIHEIDGDLAGWIEWAKKYANKVDPLLSPESLPFIINENTSYY